MGAGLLACGLDYPGLSSLIKAVLLPRGSEMKQLRDWQSFLINSAKKKFDRERGRFPLKARQKDRQVRLKTMKMASLCSS